MPIVISEEEKTAIQDFFNHPERYISDEVLASLGVFLPDGSKVSRAKRSDEDGHLIPRRYIIPSGVHGETRYIAITTIFLDDPATHSATMIHGKIYFHQNKDDLPKKLPANFERYCDLDEDDDLEDEFIVAYRAGWVRALGKPDYVLNVSNMSLFKKTVKYAVDIENHVFYLKSHYALVEGGVSLSNNAEQYAPQLYMGPPVFRRTFLYRSCQTKRIDITRDSGENLDEFMVTHIDELTSIEIELLAREILKQYLVQVNEKGIVHTDIKAANICVKINRAEGLNFDVVFIDWDEAFDSGTPCTMGNGTPGYMAPEFFKTPQDWERQLENIEVDLPTYCNTLKSNYKNLFSESSDIYALGIVLLYDLQLETSSPLYTLAKEMRHSMPSMRPSINRINEELVRGADSQTLEMAPHLTEEDNEDLPDTDAGDRCTSCCSRSGCCPCMMAVKLLSCCGFFGSSTVAPRYNPVNQNELVLSASSIIQTRMER